MKIVPYRFQLSRAKGWRMPLNSRSVSRPGVFGNPFKVELVDEDDPSTWENMLNTPSKAVFFFRQWLIGDSLTSGTFPGRRTKLLSRLPELREKNLGCWCKLPAEGQPDCCHAFALLEFANK